MVSTVKRGREEVMTMGWSPLRRCRFALSEWSGGLVWAFVLSMAIGCAGEDEDALPPISDAFIIGITPASDFAVSGLVQFAVLPRDAEGEAIIAGARRGLEVIIRVDQPANTTTLQEAETLNQPDPSVQLVSALDLDSSGSMSGNDPGALRKEAAKEFIDQLGAQDQVGVFDFGAGRTMEFSQTRLLSDFTADKAAAKAAVDRVQASGGTPMFQSIVECSSISIRDLALARPIGPWWFWEMDSPAPGGRSTLLATRPWRSAYRSTPSVSGLPRTAAIGRIPSRSGSFGISRGAVAGPIPGWWSPRILRRRFATLGRQPDREAWGSWFGSTRFR